MVFTLTYSDQANGWPSFYSYYPDWMLGMNNYFYTWKGGNLYQHNDALSPRNTFYYPWWVINGSPANAFSPSTLTSVFNPVPNQNLLFKTIDLQGDSVWDMQLSTDLQNSGYITSSWFEKKESAYFSFIRNNSSGELSLRSMTGVGTCSNATIVVPGTVTTIVFDFIIDSVISLGDLVYRDSSPVLVGKLTSIVRTSTQTTLTINTTGAPPIVSPIFYVLYIKNSIAESHGVLGHYCVFSMQNSSAGKIELFMVESDVMKSYP